MPISVPYVVLVAKQLEIQELKRLKTRSHLVGVIGQMVHVLQSERGASSIFLASAGQRFAETRLEWVTQAQDVERELRTVIENELSCSTHSNARIISLLAWVLLGLDALPELRTRISELQLSGSESVAAFSRLIAGMIALIFELADAAVDPEITRLLVALLNLIEGKEFAGQERAVGALMFGSGEGSVSLQQRIAHLIEAQDRSFRIFLEFAEEPFPSQWREMEKLPSTRQLQHLRKSLSPSDQVGVLDPDLSDAWFDCCSERLTAIWSIQRDLVERLQVRCEKLNLEAECELLDSEGLLQALRERPPARAGIIDRFFDPTFPVEKSLSFDSSEREGQHRSHSIIELLQAQSRHLAKVEIELEKSKRILNERKLIERAKGILMATHQLTEDEAYKQMRTLSMDRNLRLVEVAESVLSRT